ncbi:protein kinase [Pseudomonas sp. SWRI79]|uniref:Protein kinase n=1 Tax=Pseudomonas farris TaxID=2841207 RepID=A0ABS6PU77_9PSED|nr:protein kinase [Pseudomonas farris]MBV4463586.1 protein kinase [Pseudomonas farris]
MEASAWKKNHPGVPDSWVQLGAGGNAYVWTDGRHAIKRLKPGASREAVARFKREAEIVFSLQEVPGLSLVAVREVRERAGDVEIVMEKMDKNLEEIIHLFRGQPDAAARALLPIADTLAALARRERPIHHRDIKPSNLLFKESEQTLHLADFGCAYLAQDERLTPRLRAMGAWAYRPPEYSVGRVAEVDEKGDVFSLGKVFWAMIYGERGIVFPGPVWFEREYDLGQLFPRQPLIHHAMLLISHAAAINPNNRPSLIQFAKGLRAMSDGQITKEDSDRSIELLRAQTLIEVEYQQRQASTATFVRAIRSDFFNAISTLHKSNPELQMWREWLDEALNTPQTTGALVNQVATHESDAPVINVRYRRRVLNSSFHPATESVPAFFRATMYNEDSPSQTSMLIVRNAPDGLFFEMQMVDGIAPTGTYTPETLQIFLSLTTQRLLKV